MASKKKNPQDENETDPITEGAAEGHGDAAEAAELQGPEATSEGGNDSTTGDETGGLPTKGIHQRLEALELAMIANPQATAWPINRAAILTGTLKTALPEVIAAVPDEALRADLRTLLGLL